MCYTSSNAAKISKLKKKYCKNCKTVNYCYKGIIKDPPCRLTNVEHHLLLPT